MRSLLSLLCRRGCGNNRRDPPVTSTCLSCCQCCASRSSHWIDSTKRLNPNLCCRRTLPRWKKNFGRGNKTFFQVWLCFLINLFYIINYYFLLIFFVVVFLLLFNFLFRFSYLYLFASLLPFVLNFFSFLELLPKKLRARKCNWLKHFEGKVTKHHFIGAQQVYPFVSLTWDKWLLTLTLSSGGLLGVFLRTYVTHTGSHTFAFMNTCIGYSISISFCYISHRFYASTFSLLPFHILNIIIQKRKRPPHVN